MAMLFSKYTWSLRMTARVSKISKFGYALKNWPKNMCHLYILKNDQLPDLIHDHVILKVHLVPQDSCKLKAPKTTKFEFPLKKITI